MVLSAMSPGELAEVISAGDERMLKSIKGIGPKAAQRIIVELKDKVFGLSVTPTTLSVSVNKELQNEAVAALSALGFSPAPSHKVVSKLLSEEPSLPIEEIIKKALKML